MHITCGHYQANAKDHRADTGFTRMEATYVCWLAMGLTRKEIAKATGRSPETVRHGLDRAYHKLGVYRATAAIAEALRRGWIAPLLLALLVGAMNPGSDAMRVRQPTRTRQQVSASARISRRDTGSLYS